MNNYGFTGRILSKKLKGDTIRKGGFEVVNTPILKCNLPDAANDLCVDIGGFPSIVNYNKDRENKNKTDRENKRLRTLKHQFKRKQVEAAGDNFPSPDMIFSTYAGERKS